MSIYSTQLLDTVYSVLMTLPLSAISKIYRKSHVAGCRKDGLVLASALVRSYVQRQPLLVSSPIFVEVMHDRIWDESNDDFVELRVFSTIFLYLS